MASFMIFSAKYLYVLPIAVGIVFLALKTKKTRGTILLYSFLTLFFSYVLGKTASFFYYDPRPFFAEKFVPLIPHIADNGFPSDHTLLTSAIAFAIIPYSKFWGILLLIISLIIGAARIYVGIHSPIDILGAIIFAAIGALIANKITKKFLTSQR